MNYLTPSALKETAPAAHKLPQSDDNLINTAAFLRHIGGLGYKPVFAAQGTPHKDSETELKSRHLVVAANERGQCLAILNSHTVWRRAWLGAGFSWGHGEGSIFMLGAVVPLPRWRGIADPLAKLIAMQTSLGIGKDALEMWEPAPHEVRWLAKQIASTAYFKGHRKPLTSALWKDIPASNAWDVLQTILTRILGGGMPPEPHGKVIPPRKLKPIIAPDALMLASSAVAQAGWAGHARYQGGQLDFPAFRAYSKR